MSERQGDPLAIFEQWLPFAEMLTGMKNHLIAQGWSEEASQMIVIMSFQASLNP